eukprot:Nk52_evm8s304 gene=Nk52_evmTU8s304
MTIMSNGGTSDKFTSLPDLACEKNGGKILFATDDFFAVAENLLIEEEPVWDASRFTEFGKWMDGWETRRKRTEGHDWCIIELGCECIVEGVEIDTAHFTGNYVPAVSLQGASLDMEDAIDLKRTPGGAMGSAASEKEIRLAGQLKSESWAEIVPQTVLKPGVPETRKTTVKCQYPQPITHIRLNLFPDGGIARLKVFGRVRCNFKNFYNDASGNGISSGPQTKKMINLTDLFHGAKAIGCSDAHFGKPLNLLRRSTAQTMADGWETARKPDRPYIYRKDPETNVMQLPGHDWSILQCGHAGVIKRFVVDTNHFKGNFPESCMIYGTYLPQLLAGDHNIKYWRDKGHQMGSPDFQDSTGGTCTEGDSLHEA